MPLLATFCSSVWNPAGVLTEMLTLVGIGPPPAYVQILYTDVPLTTGPVVVSPSAAFTTDADGHGGNALDAFPDGTLPDGAAVVATPGEAVDVDVAVDEEEGVLADEHAAITNADRTTAAATAALRMRIVVMGTSKSLGNLIGHSPDRSCATT
jgi:hypothetical protein